MAEIDEALARRLVAAQFPAWAGLPVRAVAPGGWDNRSFRLGDAMVLRLPSAPEYAGHVEKEQRWLPRLAPLLPLEIPTPVAMGRATEEFPWNWSIYRWIEGEPAVPRRVVDVRRFAEELARFLVALRSIDAAEGPAAGAHNFHRGGSLSVYDAQAREAIAALAPRIDAQLAGRLWEDAISSEWRMAPVWVHGDVSAGNLLVREGRLAAVIDFGAMAVGDPACDYAIAWAWPDPDARERLRLLVEADPGTWSRARGWALWKALIVHAGLVRTNPFEAASAPRVLAEILRHPA